MSRIGLLSLLIVDNVNLQLVKRMLNKNAIRKCDNYLANKTQKCIYNFNEIWYWDGDVHMQLNKQFMSVCSGTQIYLTNDFTLALFVFCGSKTVDILQNDTQFKIYVNKKYSYESGNTCLIDIDGGRTIYCKVMSMFEAANTMINL